MSEDSPDLDRKVLAEKPAATLRVAPLADINVYLVSEERLDQLAEGSPASLLLNFGLTLGGIFLSFLSSLLAATLSDRAFIVFVTVCVVSGVSSLILLAAWWRSHRQVGNLLKQIKDQMPPRPLTPAGKFEIDKTS